MELVLFTVMFLTQAKEDENEYILGAQSIREKRLRNDGNVPSTLICVLIMLMPKKSMPNPKTALPQPCRLRFLVNVIRIKPSATAG